MKWRNVDGQLVLEMQQGWLRWICDQRDEGKYGQMKMMEMVGEEGEEDDEWRGEVYGEASHPLALHQTPIEGKKENSEKALKFYS